MEVSSKFASATIEGANVARFSQITNKVSLPKAIFLLLILCFSLIATHAYANTTAVASLSITSATTVGGVNTVITGTNLTGVTSVTVGGVAATVVSNTATRVEITVPAGTVGAKDVVVNAAGGSATSVNGFTYYVTLTPSCGTSGSFTISSNVVRSHTACTGTVTVPEGVTSIAAGNPSGAGFYNAPISGTVSLPSTLRTIGDQAFYGTGLIQVMIPKSVTNIDGAFWTSNITAITFETPSSLTSIGASTLRTTANLTTLTIPEGVTSLGNLAIATSGLRTISLPSTLVSITTGGSSSFSGTGLGCVANPGNTAFINNFAFPAGPVNFPAAGNAFTTSNPLRVTNFSDCALPTISSLGTISGPTVGGTLVVVNGSNLTGTRAVKIGTFDATVVESTATTATIRTPIGTGINRIHLVANTGWVTAPAEVVFSYITIPNRVAVTRTITPETPVSNQAFGNQPQVRIQDALGNTVSTGTGSTFRVTATVNRGALIGTVGVNAVAGVATFTNLGILGITGDANRTYTITFTASGLATASQTVEIARNCDGVRFECEVGDIGPGGGTIFYVAPEFFTQPGATATMCRTECKYLEVAPRDWDRGTVDPNGAWSTDITTATEQDRATASNQSSNAAEKVNWQIGQGFNNTRLMKVDGATTAIRDRIIAYTGTLSRTAGQWFIPSVNELNELCKWSSDLPTGDLKTPCAPNTSLMRMPGFWNTSNQAPFFSVNTRYWSSSEASAAEAWSIRFSTEGIFPSRKTGDTSNSFTGHWRPIRAFGATPIYEITLRSGANGAGVAQTLEKTRGTNLILPDSATANGYFTRTGFTVTGWSTSDGGAKTHDLGGAFTTEASTNLYPFWTGNNLTVTYDTKGGSNVSTSSTVSGGSVASAPTRPTRDGYTFAGWSATNGGVAITFPYTHGATSNFTLHALWTANTYTISFLSNGANGSPSATAATFTTGGTAVTLPVVGTMVKTGYNFGGWSTTPTGSAHVGTFTTTSDTSLWAVWTIKTISVTYSEGVATRASLTGFPSNTSGDFGTTITLNSTISTTTTIGGITHEFAGWSDGVSVYRSGSPYVLGETPPTLTAIWTRVFGVRYSFNGGTPAIGTSQTDSECLSTANTCTDGQQIVANVAPSRAGYNFAGWVDQNNVSVTAGAMFTVSANRYLIYANWTPIDYAISFDAAGGSTPPSSFTKQKDQSFVLANGPTRSGYTFDGWNDGQSTFGAGTLYFVGTSPVTLTAQWRANTYIIAFDWNGSVGTPTTPMTYTVGGNALTLPAVGNHVKDGYVFDGWSTSIDGTQISNSYTPTSSGTLYARWEAVSSSSTTTDSPGSSGSQAQTPGNVINVPSFRVTGARAVRITTVGLGLPNTDMNVKVDLASQRTIARASVVNGNLVLTPRRGYSGVRTKTVTVTANGVDFVIQISLTVLPERVKSPIVSPASSTTSIVKWSRSPNAKRYSVFLNNKRICFTARTSCTVQRVLGPSSVVTVVSNGADRTVSKKARARFQR